MEEPLSTRRIQANDEACECGLSRNSFQVIDLE
jgi:hypothetical protein